MMDDCGAFRAGLRPFCGIIQMHRLYSQPYQSGKILPLPGVLNGNAAHHDSN